MSIVVNSVPINPEIPEEYLQAYPYYLIVNVLIFPAIIGSTKPFFHANADIVGTMGVDVSGSGIVTLGDIVSANVKNGEWTIQSDSEGLAGISDDDGELISVVWSNHPILEASSIDLESRTFETTGEVLIPDIVTLPDIPEECASNTPYSIILSMASEIALFSSSEPLVAVADDLLGEDLNVAALIGIQPGTSKMYLLSEGAWIVPPDEDDVSGEVTELEMTYPSHCIIWSNHDILNVESYDETTGVYTLSTEVFFPNSLAESKPTFVLPDGTELPALPDGCWEGKPYGAISHDVDGDWSLMTRQSPAYVEDNDDGVPAVFLPIGRQAMWLLVDGEWQFFYEMEFDATSEWILFAKCPVVWLNYDMIFGSEIARKSDVNYRVTDGFMRSIANQTRRICNTIENMKPDKILDALKALIETQEVNAE